VRIGLDVTPLAGPLTGIGRFTHELAAALAAADDVDVVPIALTGRSRQRVRELLPANVAPGLRSFPARPLLELWKRFDHPTVRRLFGPVDLVHGTNFYGPPPGRGVAELITVHDTGPWLRPGEVPPIARLFPALVERSLRRGAHVHALSHTAADEIQSLLDLPAERVHPVPLAVEPIEPVDLPSGLAAMLDGHRYVLAVGTIEPRKRFPELVTGLAHLLGPELRLVIAGGAGSDSDRLRRVLADRGDLSDSVILTGFVSERDKRALLSHARAVVSAAKSEGFGMVPLEAMSAGTPVVATDGGAQPEVCGDAALLVPSGDLAGLGPAVLAVIDDTELRGALIERGRVRAGHYSWATTTSALIDLYARLV
jgi:glycosyltransferase involved in cell wall biosynthesis